MKWKVTFLGAAFFLVANKIGNDVKCLGLNYNSLQGDKQILDILDRDLKDLRIDAKDIPDLVPILTVLCCFAKGESRIINAGRLRMKESDRLLAISTELNKLGAKITEGEDYLVIQEIDDLHGGVVDSWGDHRIAMSLAIASTKATGDVIIQNKEVVNKSYPKFWDDMKGLM